MHSHRTAIDIVPEWLHAQGKDSPTAWTVLRSGPYAETLSEFLAPRIESDGTAVFSFPMGNGVMPFIALEDFGKYVDWILNHLSETRGLDFAIATENAGLSELAKAFTAATGRKARAEDMPFDVFAERQWSRLPDGPDTKVGFISVKDNMVLNQSFRENFSNWFNLYKSSRDSGVFSYRDYAFLDKILPDRVRSMEEWMVKTGYTGESRSVLKLYDGLAAASKN
jgi:hypothetical protein